MKTLLFILLAAVTAVVRATTLAPTAPEPLEPIHLFKMTRGVMSIGVASSGYTTEKSFRLDLTKNEKTRTYTLRIVRIAQDVGKMMPMPTVITFKLADLKIDPHMAVKVENPFYVEGEW
jgi:hypothetical protein